uniref:Uncharacterized protein n=1 Tax=Arundo donax TaxID=35708 RepID=A0A0A9CTV5_ARUDO
MRDDGETCDIAIKFMKLDLSEIQEYKKMKASGIVTGEQSGYDTSCNEGANDSETEGEAGVNNFGAAGCSAGLSDSELMSLRPPLVNRKTGRPRITRFKSRQDYIKKITKRSLAGAARSKKRGKACCTTCDLVGHDASECMEKTVDV